MDSSKVIGTIVSHLYSEQLPENTTAWDRPAKPKLHNYAPVSLKWQDEVERLTFSRLKLSSTETSEFKRIFAGSRRRDYLRRLEYVIVLPNYGANRVQRLETKKEHAANQVVFEEGIKLLPECLSSWRVEKESFLGVESRSKRRRLESNGSLELVLTSYAPMDPGHRPKDYLHQLDILDFGAERWRGNYLAVPRDLELEQMSAVTALEMPLSGRSLHPSVCGRLLGVLPSIEMLDLQLVRPKPREDSKREQHGNGESISDLQGSRLTLRRACEHTSQRKQSTQSEAMLGDDVAIQPFLGPFNSEARGIPSRRRSKSRIIFAANSNSPPRSGAGRPMAVSKRTLSIALSDIKSGHDRASSSLSQDNMQC